MQSLVWYQKRLMSMSLSEVLWRAKRKALDQLDRFRVEFHLLPRTAKHVLHHPGQDGESGFHVFNRFSDDNRAVLESWKTALVQKAEQIAAHQLSFFDLQNVFLGSPIAWNRDHGHGRAAPMGYAQSIDYRDFRVTGDCKLVWEPNRHHQWVVLGRAYCATGDLRYAAEVVAQMESWMDQCPYGKGMNWRSPLELGIRMINWIWTIDLIRESGLVAGAFKARLFHFIYLHLWEITRRYSQGSSANNHLIGEAAGVFIASRYLKDLPNAPKWADESQASLEREIITQTYEDGCTREHAMGYHLFALQLFLITGLVGRWSEKEFSSGYWQRIERMCEFAAALSEGSGQLPALGDADDGYVLGLGKGAPGVKELLCIGAICFGRSDFKAIAGDFREPALWLFGPEAKRRFDDLPSLPPSRRLPSRNFNVSGYYLLQCGAAADFDRISVVVDCAELGFKSLSAHGHADALSFVLCAFGREIFVDPGTFDYFTYPEWRSYFRGTRAHNTVVVDDLDQSVMMGPFMWGQRASVRSVEWTPWPEGGGRLVAEHDGYSRLKDPVYHRRTFELNPSTRCLSITDRLSASTTHRIAICFHLAEDSRAALDSQGNVCIEVPEGKLTLTVDPRLKLTLFEGSENPHFGWVSRGYHRKVPAPTVVAEGLCQGNDTFHSVIAVELPKT